MSSVVTERSDAASHDARSVLRNSAASIAGQFATLAVGLISSVYVARTLGSKQFGMLAWATGLTGIVMAFANLGIDNILVREVAKHRERAAKYLFSAFLLKTFSASLCMAGIVTYLHVRGYSGMQLAVGYILCTTVILEGFNFACRSVLTGLERQDTTALLSLVVGLLRVASVILLVWLGFNIVLVAWATVAGCLLMVVGQVAIIRRLSGDSSGADRGVSVMLLGQGWTFLLSQALAGFFDRSDYLILEAWKGPDPVGLYSAAYRIIDIAFVAGYSYSAAMFPILSRRAAQEDGGRDRAVAKATRYLVLVGFPGSMLVFLLSHELIAAIYGPKFAAAGGCLALLMWSRIAMFTVLPGQQSVAARQAQLWLVPPIVVRLVLNLGLNFYLIPRYSYIGACWAMIISENVYYVATYFISFRGGERFSVVDILLKPGLAVGAMAGAFYLVRPVGAAPAAIAAVATYVLGVFALKLLDSDDKRMIRSILKRRGTA